jgi:hypothetical protein
MPVAPIIQPVTPTETLMLASPSDLSSVLVILMVSVGIITLAVVGMYMMKMMKW